MTENEPLDPEAAAAKERARQIAAAYIRAAGVDVTKQATWAAPAAEAAPASEGVTSAAAAAPAIDAQAAAAQQAAAQAAAQQATAQAAAPAQAVAAQAAAAPAQAAAAQTVAAQATAPAQAVAAQAAAAQATAPAQAVAAQATAPAASPAVAAPVAAQAAAPVAATAAMPPVDAPVYAAPPVAPAPEAPTPDASVQQTFAPVPEEKKGGAGRIIGIIVLILGILIVLGIIAFLFFPNILSSGNTPVEEPEATEQVQINPLSDVSVITAFDESGMEAPDLSTFAYVSQDPLIGPQFGDIVLNEITNTTAVAGQPIECTATATATFKNKGIEIAVPVTLPFEYAPESGTWTPGELVRGDAIGEPLAGPNATEIVENLAAILQADDPTFAEEMAEADITKTTSDLSKDGGTIDVDLSTTVVEEDDKAKRTILKNSSVTLAVAWSPTEGWIVSVSNFGEIEKETIKTEGKIEGQGSADGDQGATLSPAPAQQPDNVGTANYGDTITLSGTLQAVEKTADLASGNGYTNANATETADGAVRLVLVLARPLDITLNGTSYRLTSVALALGDNISDSQVQSLYGDTGTVEGSIDEKFVTNWTPVGLKVTSVNVNR